MRNGLAVIVTLACGGVLAAAQTPEAVPRFDVATIKLSGRASPPLSIQRLPGGRLVTSNTSLPMLIQWAYQLDEGRLLGVPKGLDSRRFDIVAQAPEREPVAGRMQLMMRALLSERFKLVVHHETRELTTFVLVTDEGGAKVRASNGGEPASPNPFRMSDRGSLTGTRVTADMLATVLSNQLGRPVQNMTEFSGVFDFTLQWTPDTPEAVLETSDRPSLFTAIREQLGFRLISRKTATEVVVIDRVEGTPTAN